MATAIAFPKVQSSTSQQDDMKLTAEDKRWLSGEIKTQVANGLREFGDLLNPHGWRKFVKVARELAPLGVSATMIVALLTFAATAIYQANNRSAEDARFQQQTADRLEGIEKDIKDLKVNASLSSVSTAIQLAKSGSEKPNPPELKQISDKLSSVQQQYPDLPQVWQTTSLFINYKSEALLPESQKVFAKASGMNCRGGGPVTMGREATFNGCEVSLEYLAKNFAGNTSNGAPVPFVFVNCIVDYAGGKVPDAPMVFRNSIFRFNVSVAPPSRGVQTMRLLTASLDVTQIQIPGA
ncbi:MAG TPA: hypothetical protein VGE83_10275 [Terracidiphilus sp.]|jgi:hypothetical protein